MDHCRFRSSHTYGASSKGHDPENELQQAPRCHAMGGRRDRLQPLLQAAGPPSTTQAVACSPGAEELPGAVTKLAMEQQDPDKLHCGTASRQQPSCGLSQPTARGRTTSPHQSQAASCSI